MFVALPTLTPTPLSEIRDHVYELARPDAKGAFIYNVRTEVGVGGGSRKAYNLRTNTIDFADREGEGQQIPTFYGRHIWKPLRRTCMWARD